ncbi:p53-induced death domain-containing protein 1 isoform X1 [Colossoma macropomum]|uniref:p53-induced death domain-containing protein 1 isoform X1 n=1 Tax=Colossoma macropomum TaxID=42526 RepID=UPI0018640185|nr:p53-induced death domain-containing protein 1 isoform X1 [Colossoma macropomum]XP_036432383.1 p53-induced death domain-containing protein 1 isoform X1 [Colossoma macropomum]XP_036432384.1 p53-induced death domain-containing protein 1 isoform X1 [Colossoma macropomum]
MERKERYEEVYTKDEGRQAATGEEQQRGETGRFLGPTGVMTVEKGRKRNTALHGLGEAASDVDRPGLIARQHANGVEELETKAKLERDVLASIRRALRRQAEVLDGETFHSFPSLSDGHEDASSTSSSSSPLPSALLSTLSISSSSPQLSLTPPLPPSVELDTLLVDGRLVLDVYQCGGTVMPALWDSVPERMRRLQYVRLGSEDEEALEGAFRVLPRLTQLRSLAIRGHRFYDAQSDPLPGLLTSLPASISSLSLLVHLDLSFNRLSSLPACILSLSHLSELLLCHNQLDTLPEELGALVSLQRLSVLGNKLQALPPGVGLLLELQELDVSFNQLESLPEELGLLLHLHTLELSNNKLQRLPETLGSLHSLRVLAIHSNELRNVPECVRALPQLTRLDVRNNPLGRPPTPPPLPPAPAAEDETPIPELHLAFNQHRFSISPTGCHVFLPGGAELLFPRGCVGGVTQFKWAERKPDKKWVQLEEHDFLLNRPLELLPHGTTFNKPVDVCVPYHKTRKGEVVVRKYDGQSWSTLPTLTRRGSHRHSSRPRGRPARLACCTVKQFSWFVAVSRPVRDSCSVSPAGALLVSRYDPGIKLTFPPDCTTNTRTVTLQVLQVALSEVQDLTGDPQASASPLLCLSQTPSLHFLQPVRVQIPLPPGLTGHTVDMSRLHLLHGDPVAHTWTDVTAQVSLYITQLYAIFSVTHFSWYWLWYTTQSCISGVVRKVYHRLKQFRVQFLVLQRKTDLTQVLLQCLPSDKVDSRLASLSEQYDGPQPSDVCNLLEGEQFFAGFERGIDISADRPDCSEGRLAFTFYSHLKNIKEVHVCPTDKQEDTVRGQVSFYRGKVPSDLPEEVARKRKGLDSQWMATLPLRLPGTNCEGSLYSEKQYPPLNLGDPESGYLTETNLLAISLRISQDWRCIGMNLGISYQELDRIQYKHRDNLGALVLEMLFHWARGQQKAGAGAVPRLIDALVESGRRDLAEEVEDIVNLGKRKYRESLKRVGLETENPTTSTQSEPS